MERFDKNSVFLLITVISSSFNTSVGAGDRGSTGFKSLSQTQFEDLFYFVEE